MITKKIQIQLGLLASLMYAVSGSISALQGSSKLDIIRQLGVDSSKLQIVFTFFAIGILIGVSSLGELIKKMNMKITFLFIPIVISTFTILFVNANNLFMLCIEMFLLGLATSVYNFFGSYLIIHFFIGKEKISGLNITNLFYSISSSIIPLFLVILSNFKISWKYSSSLVIFFNILILLIIFLIGKQFNELEFYNKNEENKAKVKKKLDLHKNNILVGASVFLYVFSEFILVFWLVESLVLKGISESKAKIAMFVLWIFIAIGRALASVVGKHIRVKLFIQIISMLAFLSSLILLKSTNYSMIIILISFIGLGYSAQYASLTLYGSSFIYKNEMSRLVGFYIGMGSLGGLLISPITSILKNIFDIQQIMMLSVIQMLLLFILITLTNERDV